MFHRLQLEARNLQGDHGASRKFIRYLAQRSAQIPQGFGPAPAFADEVSYQFRGGGFSVGAGDGHQIGLAEGGSQFHFP